jgi:type I restriction enzyme S subunit
MLESTSTLDSGRTIFTESLFESALPRDWKLVAVGEVLTDSEYGLSEPGDVSGDTPIVGMSDLVNGTVNLINLATVNSGGDDWSSMRLRRGDVLLNRTNSPDLVGKVGIVREDTEAVFASYLVRLHVDQSVVHPEFVNYWLNSAIAQRAMKRLSTRGVSQANINPTEFRKHCPFPLAPIGEQRQIVEILYSWDEAGAKLEALKASKERRYLALSRKLFDPCYPKFPMRSNAWRAFELGDVFNERDQSGNESDRLLSITMNGGVIDREDVGRKDTSTEDKSKYKLILPGDIGYNTMRMWQGVSGLSALRGIISPAYTVLIPIQERILGRYAAHLFKSRRMVFDFERYSQGLTSDTWNLKFPAFSKIKVFLPHVDDQEKQANVLDALIAELDVIERQINLLTRQKRGLMQKLLTGEWRVKIDSDEGVAI